MTDNEYMKHLVRIKGISESEDKSPYAVFIIHMKLTLYNFYQNVIEKGIVLNDDWLEKQMLEFKNNDISLFSSTSVNDELMQSIKETK